jgi:hypothetical protein
MVIFWVGMFTLFFLGFSLLTGQETLNEVFIELNVLFDKVLAVFFLNFVIELFDGLMDEAIVFKLLNKGILTSLSLIDI